MHFVDIHNHYLTIIGTSFFKLQFCFEGDIKYLLVNTKLYKLKWIQHFGDNANRSKIHQFHSCFLKI